MADCKLENAIHTQMSEVGVLLYTHTYTLCIHNGIYTRMRTLMIGLKAEVGGFLGHSCSFLEPHIDHQLS